MQQGHMGLNVGDHQPLGAGVFSTFSPGQGPNGVLRVGANVKLGCSAAGGGQKRLAGLAVTPFLFKHQPWGGAGGEGGMVRMDC